MICTTASDSTVGFLNLFFFILTEETEGALLFCNLKYGLHLAHMKLLNRQSAWLLCCKLTIVHTVIDGFLAGSWSHLASSNMGQDTLVSRS